MLKFYKSEDDTFTRWVTDKMERMVVAHRVIEIDGNDDEHTDLPKKRLTRKSYPYSATVMSNGRTKNPTEISWTNYIGIFDSAGAFNLMSAISIRIIPAHACNLSLWTKSILDRSNFWRPAKYFS